ncbi:MAG: hypothetical protein QOF88_2267 [Mycobacterium sp.]|nr:hypothetical protein [Mycobacterium sp.]MDT5201126.1 hypothetical protein [Mycobacterium sp.]MDT5287378.1 hypothetical protein [Mycobacterium sp.]
MTMCLRLAALTATVAMLAPTAPAAAEPTSGRCGSTAADALGWGPPNRVEDFDEYPGGPGWEVYDSVGHGGNGIRTPNALTVGDGVLTITGDELGNSGGLALLPGQLYGRWEVCMKSAPASPNYHSVALLWPDSNVWPNDGEIDFMEILDPARTQVTASVLHARPASIESMVDPNDHADIAIDATQWHSWAVDWTPDRITGYVDGAPWFESARHVPAGPMHMCIQLDDFGGDLSGGGQVSVDWVRQYPFVSTEPGEAPG